MLLFVVESQSGNANVRQQKLDDFSKEALISRSQEDTGRGVSVDGDMGALSQFTSERIINSRCVSVARSFFLQGGRPTVRLQHIDCLYLCGLPQISH